MEKTGKFTLTDWNFGDAADDLIELAMRRHIDDFVRSFDSAELLRMISTHIAATIDGEIDDNHMIYPNITVDGLAIEILCEEDTPIILRWPWESFFQYTAPKDINALAAKFREIADKLEQGDP